MDKLIDQNINQIKEIQKMYKISSKIQKMIKDEKE